jgi:sRNA-binding protein
MSEPTDLPVQPLPDDTAPHLAAAQPGADATPHPAADGSDAAHAEGPDALAQADSENAGDSAGDNTNGAADSTPAAVPGAPALPQLNPAACAELLRQHFPALFSGPAKPFKLRIQQDIQQRAPGVFSKGTLSAFFRRHTGSTGYLIALSKATHRFDLDGQPAGELSEEHKQLAQAELTRRRQLMREREQQAQAQQREQQRAQQQEAQRAQQEARRAQQANQAQQAEADQARQARAALLRDFQRTTLTLANFCALKGMTPEVLNPLLEQAKKDAAEAPPVPVRAFDDRRGPGPRRDERPPARPDARGPRRDDRRPARPGVAAGAPGGRGPRGPAGQS